MPGDFREEKLLLSASFRAISSIGHTLSKNGLTHPKSLIALILSLLLVIGVLTIPAAVSDGGDDDSGSDENSDEDSARYGIPDDDSDEDSDSDSDSDS